MWVALKVVGASYFSACVKSLEFRVIDLLGKEVRVVLISDTSLPVYKPG